VTRHGQRARRLAVAILCLVATVSLRAHGGPPSLVVSDVVAGPYRVSLWADPDATDDGSSGGEFWVVLDAASGKSPVPPGTAVRVSISLLDPPGRERTALAEVVARDNPARRYAALPIDREGRVSVRLDVEGPLGPARVDAEVDATYDLRPAPVLILVFAIPLVLAGLLWTKLLLARRRSRATSTS
jgi:hypothetical protein